MRVTRHFIGWDNPLSTAVARHLLPSTGMDGPLDFSNTLLIVPTRQAGRSLRESLALLASEQGNAVLSLRTVTSASFLFPESPDSVLADETIVTALWTRVLLDADPKRHATFFGVLPNRDFTWAMQTAQILTALRRDLSEAGLTINGVVARHGAELEEPERWQEMADLENVFLAKLNESGLSDPQSEQIHGAGKMAPPANITTILLACVPDPPPLMIHAMERLQADIDIDVLIAAPVDKAAMFDDWGRPLPEAWEEVLLEPAGTGDNLILADSPSGQSQAVLGQIAADPNTPGPSDIAIGVPDRTVVPFLLSSFERCGVPVFDPDDKRLADHSLYHLLALWCAFLTQRSYRPFADLLRHPDVLRHFSLHPNTLLTELDEFQNAYLPLTLDEVRTRFSSDAAPRPLGRTYPELAAVLESVEAAVTAFREQELPAALRSFLRSVYDSRILEAGNGPDDEYAQAARLVNDIIGELETGPYRQLGLSREQSAQILVTRLSEQRYHREREQDGIDLLGWLELPWTEATRLFVTGMNEGAVPDSKIGDSFLPDGVRRQLGLRCDATRLARDAFLMKICIESRRARGRCCLICGKASAEGDPLKPSRLLFRCTDTDLPQRAALLFGDASDSRPSLTAQLTYKLQPNLTEEDRHGPPVPAGLSVTAFSRYLACPFRFYLSDILKMGEADDRKREMDALDFGSMMHAVVEGIARDPALRTCSDESRLSGFLVSAARAWFTKQYGARLATPLLVSLDSACERLKAVARAQAFLAQDGWEIIAHEQKLEMVVAGIAVRGMIDRIDRHRDTGQLRLIDYKTKDTAQSPEEAHVAPVRDVTPGYAHVVVGDKTRRWTDLQLPLYFHLRRAQQTPQNDMSAGSVELAYFNIPKAVTHTGIYTWENCSQDILDSALDCAEAIVEKIKASAYWPPVETVRYDDFESLGCGYSLEEVFAPPVPTAGSRRRSPAKPHGHGPDTDGNREIGS